MGALLAAACYGVATVLQALAASHAARGAGLDPRLLLRVLRQVPFMISLLLDTAGFGLSLAALRHLPLYVVEAIVAANLAVAAVVAARVLRLRLLPREWAAVGTVCAGLVLLVLSAGEQAPVRVGRGFEVGLLVTTLTTATGPLVVAETVAPALVGVIALGDAARPGYALVGLAGFLLAGAGALALARFGSLDPATSAR